MIKRLVQQYAPLLKVPDTIAAEAALWALYRCEKYNAFNHSPRFEKAYAPGGRYYETSPFVKELHSKWGDYAACSYSNFQILYVTAVELGYKGPPLGLDKDEIALPFVVKYLNTRVFGKGASTPEDVADAYNSGNHKDAVKPWKYIRRFMKYYDMALKGILYELRPTTPEADTPSNGPGEGVEPCSSDQGAPPSGGGGPEERPNEDGKGLPREPSPS